ncbi:uncharacterized protein BKA78DRAFT_174010 [Phyllosticta capitalensis]|uniref:Uncharacterized protein n=1 Tax=Phyllosticta capitalensis TaxID=121624 RepID=A0ABR1YAS2_9PEZI
MSTPAWCRAQIIWAHEVSFGVCALVRCQTDLAVLTCESDHDRLVGSQPCAACAVVSDLTDRLDGRQSDGTCAAKSTPSRPYSDLITRRTKGDGGCCQGQGSLAS